MIKGIIFDYNGTLFFDEEYNISSWKKCLKELTDGRLDFDSFYYKRTGTLDYFQIKDACDMFNIPYDDEFINKWVHYKEELYHEDCINSGKFYLDEGTISFLNFVKERKIPINMATASIKFNTDFYFEYLNLDKWFDQSIIAYDDGTYSSKEGMYRDAAKRINLDIKDCLVLEDSKKSMQEAIKAGCKNVIYVNSRNIKLDFKEIIQEVKSFSEIDKSIFDK